MLFLIEESTMLIKIKNLKKKLQFTATPTPLKIMTPKRMTPKRMTPKRMATKRMATKKK